MAGPAAQGESLVRYVVQEHSGFGPVHYDFMVEQGGVLWTWQLDLPPDRWRIGPVAARRIGDHRLAYLDYEGPISGNRGRCRIVARGRCRVVQVEPGAVRLELSEGAMAGTAELVRTAPDSTLWELRVLCGPASA